MMRLLLTLMAGLGFSSLSIAGDQTGKAHSRWAGKSAMPRAGCKLWMGGRETSQQLPLPLDVMAEVDGWLFVQGGKVRTTDVVPSEEAAAYYRSLLQANPMNAWAMAMLGWCNVSDENYEQARQWLDKATQMDAKNGDAWLARGASYAFEEDYETAIKQFDEAIRLRPDCALAYYCRGLYKSESGDQASALADYNTAIKICPEFSLAYMARGAVYDDNEKWPEALADFDQSLSLDPFDDVALVRRARIRATCPIATYRDGKLAIQDAQKACEISKYKDWEDLEVLAAAYAEAGRFADAVKTQTKVVELTKSGRHFMMRLQLERYKQNKTYKFPPTDEQP